MAFITDVYVMKYLAQFQLYVGRTLINLIEPFFQILALGYF